MRSVLIIDNDISFIVRLRKALETQQFMVKTTRRLAAAQTELSENTFEIVVIDIAFDEFEAALHAVRAQNFELPIILSGRSESDAIKVNFYKAQAYINKPYIARDLMAIIEWTLAKSINITALDDDALDINEPPINEDATIGDMFTDWVSAEEPIARGDSRPTELPESTSALDQQLAAEEPPFASGDSVASRVLRFSNNESQVASLIKPRESAAIEVQPLPSWHTPPTAEEQAKLIALLGELPPQTLPATSNALLANTQPLALPEIDLIPEDPTPMPDFMQRSDRLNDDLLAALADAEDAEDSRLQAALRNMSPASSLMETMPTQDELVSTSVKEITQSMGIVLEDEVSDTLAEEEDEPDTELEAATLVAQAALQLTQLSLESAAIGTMLTYDGRIIGNIGDLGPVVWQDLATQINAAWQQGDSSNTRLVYRMLERHGQVLLFSLRTADDLVLTLIFSASTPLRMIRQQAKRITEALADVEPDALSAELQNNVPRVQPTTDTHEEPPAAITTPSRPTGLKPPPHRDEVVKQTETDTTKPRAAEPYDGYALLWLVQNTALEMNEDVRLTITTWLNRVAEENLWDIINVEIQDEWINLHVEVPTDVLPSEFANVFMKRTQQALKDTFAHLADEQSLWSEDYSVLTPGRLMSNNEIERFIRYSALAQA